MSDDDLDGQRLRSRRRFLQTIAAATAYGLARPSSILADSRLPRAGEVVRLDATSPEGIDLTIERTQLRVAGGSARAITLNGSIPGPEIHMREGRDALIRVHNRLDDSTSIHWHGILLPYDMDGVPGISFAGIPPGETFTYRYPVRQNGTYWYHSHTGLQEQLGHYGALVVEPASSDPVAYDVDYTVVLSDWTFMNPHTVARKLKTIEGYFNYQRPTVANLDDQMAATEASLLDVIDKRLAWRWMRMDPTDIADVTGATYEYLMNGHDPGENWTAVARPGERVRLRFVNASAVTFYDVRIPGLPMTIVQADGQNVEPVETDEFRIGVAETYDVIVTMPEGRAYTIFAETMDRSGFARGTLAPRRGMSAELPVRRRRAMLTMADMGMMMDHGGHSNDASMHRDRTERPAEHSQAGAFPTTNLPDRVEHGPDGHGPASITMARTAYRQLDDPGLGLGHDGRRVLTYGQLRCLETPSDRRPPTREFDLHLTGNMPRYIWGFDGKKWKDSEMIRFQYGERLRINMINDTMMSHPIHLHGMWMDLYAGHAYDRNPRKHTVVVQPSELLSVDISVDAPGQWAFHCHILYHMEAGMFRTVAVVRSLEGGPIDVTA